MEEITSGTNLFLYLIYCFIDKNRYINKQIKWRHLYKYELLNGTCDPGQTSHCLKQNYSQVTQCHQDITQGFFFLALLCTSSKMMWLDSKSILPIRWWRYFTQTQYLICCDTVIIIKGNPLQKQTNKQKKQNNYPISITHLINDNSKVLHFAQTLELSWITLVCIFQHKYNGSLFGIVRESFMVFIRLTQSAFCHIFDCF